MPAKAELDAAQQAYDELLTTQEATDMLDARAQVWQPPKIVMTLPSIDIIPC